jgi:L-lactate dehydrogenase complex protein LldE
MLKKHYPGLFAEGTPERAAAEALSAKTFELVSFLTDIMGLQRVEARFPHRVTYHDACSGLRELGVERQPRALLASVEGLELAEMSEAQICCGFGGTFCVKYPDISNDMLEKKAESIAQSGAEVVLAGDLGCLMNMAGKLKRLNSGVETRHVAEVLAGLADGPAIGEAE